MKGRKISDVILFGLTWFLAAVTFLTLIFILVYILMKGVPHLKPSLFEMKYTSENASMTPSIISTFLMVVMTLVIAIPLGVFSSIYLCEYAKKTNRIVGLVRLTTETLSGIPSIIYGLFGSLFFVGYLGLKLSLLSGALTLSIMILPLIMRTTEEALKSVPQGFREGSFALGAGKLRTVFRIVLPSAMPGIIAGIILSIGRIVGETAAIIYTAGTFAQIPSSVFDSVRTLSVHMWALSSESFYTNEAYATAVVLLIIVLAINLVSTRIAKRFMKG